ncbi:hypothetical protein K469DRAFT_366213 [Zopfia rhizophila CBS 207.26]|uniref:Uncharacterized protein n=1 Tax=Zopfia rhizophila CBS 207.26 TaxID=1314779 RepID=A0A6A6EJ85_9PEZI|nr:hypothetical protein K469DRAFT_366213 [Zopfia rhizophila CBS 207.26]
MFFHNSGMICTIKTEVNWMVRTIPNDPRALHFQPTDREKDPHFAASLIQPAEGQSVAGLPLCTQVFRHIENLEVHRFEADLFELEFATDAVPQEFNSKYRQIKKAWDQEMKEVQKQQGWTRRPHEPHLDVPGLNLSTKPRHQSGLCLGFNIAEPIGDQPLPLRVNKGKGKAVDLPSARENGFLSGSGSSGSNHMSNLNHVPAPHSPPTLLLRRPTETSYMEEQNAMPQPSQTTYHKGGGRGRGSMKTWG